MKTRFGKMAGTVLAMLVIGIGVGTGAMCFAQDAEVETPRLPDSEREVRPSKDMAPVATVAPTGQIRGSLFKAGAMTPVPLGSDGAPIGSAPVSFTSVSAPRPKKFKKNDLVTIVVQEDSAYTSNAQSQSQKQQDFDLALQSWFQLHTSGNGLPKVAGVGSSGTLPEAKFKYDNNRQNQATQDRTDSLSLRIAATVVDVKPNGTMVLEAGKDIVVDREVQHYHMSGVCRAEDITPDNTLLSSQLANLSMNKQTSGEVKDGVKSGWLNTIIDKVNPF